MNEGMSYAILLGNLMTPWFNAWGHQTPLGYKKPKKAKKAAEEGAKPDGKRENTETRALLKSWSCRSSCWWLSA